MLKLKQTIIVLAYALLSITAMWSISTPAQAKLVGPFKSSYSDVLGACIKVKGVWSEDAGGYGCTKPNCDGKGGSCTVGCTNDDMCNGSTPGKKLVGTTTLRGLLQNGSLVSHFYGLDDETGTRNNAGSTPPAPAPAPTTAPATGTPSAPVPSFL